MTRSAARTDHLAVLQPVRPLGIPPVDGYAVTLLGKVSPAAWRLPVAGFTGNLWMPAGHRGGSDVLRGVGRLGLAARLTCCGSSLQSFDGCSPGSRKVVER